MCSGSEAGSYLRLIDSGATQLKAQGLSRTCNDSKEEEDLAVQVGLLDGVHVSDMHDPRLAAPHPHHRPVLQHLAPVRFVNQFLFLRFVNQSFIFIFQGL